MNQLSEKCDKWAISHWHKCQKCPPRWDPKLTTQRLQLATKNCRDTAEAQTHRAHCFIKPVILKMSL